MKVPKGMKEVKENSVFGECKKKRIQKKFKKLYLKTFMVPSPNFYIFGNKIFCHPVYYEKLNILIKGK